MMTDTQRVVVWDPKPKDMGSWTGHTDEALGVVHPNHPSHQDADVGGV